MMKARERSTDYNVYEGMELNGMLAQFLASPATASAASEFAVLSS
jgi:hypothetical protein